MSQIIEIKHGNTTAKISTAGAEIISFKGKDGKEHIWQADPQVWGRHAPVLFPVVCAVKNNTAIIDGVSYPMTKHGFVRDWEYVVAEKREDMIDLAAIIPENSKEVYPFDYELHVIFKVSVESFECRFKVINKSEKMMPFCIGGHPAFVCPMEDGCCFEEYEVVFSEKESGERAVLTPDGEICGREFYEPLKDNDRFKLDYAFFDANDTLILPALKSRSVKLINPKSGKGIKFDFAGMPVLAIWTKSSARPDYVCLEPWQGLPAGIDESSVLEDKPFAVKLEAGGTYETGFSAEII